MKIKVLHQLFNIIVFITGGYVISFLLYLFPQQTGTVSVDLFSCLNTLQVITLHFITTFLIQSEHKYVVMVETFLWWKRTETPIPSFRGRTLKTVCSVPKETTSAQKLSLISEKVKASEKNRSVWQCKSHWATELACFFLC